jgi:hypothetical protein
MKWHRSPRGASGRVTGDLSGSRPHDLLGSGAGAHCSDGAIEFAVREVTATARLDAQCTGETNAIPPLTFKRLVGGLASASFSPE